MTTEPLVINGWTVYAHPTFIEQFDSLHLEVQELKKKDPANFAKKNAAKRFAAIAELVFNTVPADPERPEYRQGATLGAERKHWFRAKFFQQYRLFFRYHKQSKVIVFAWVNDDETKRAYGSGSDAYKVFERMLKAGHPPDDWDQLLAESVDALEDWQRAWVGIRDQ